DVVRGLAEVDRVIERQLAVVRDVRVVRTDHAAAVQVLDDLVEEDLAGPGQGAQDEGQHRVERVTIGPGRLIGDHDVARTKRVNRLAHRGGGEDEVDIAVTRVVRRAGGQRPGDRDVREG